MEAVPRLPMLCLELKSSPESPNFASKLKQYIADFYREDPESYNHELHQLEGLRSAAVRPAIDKTGCVALKRYFGQLRGLQSRFPMSKGQPAAVTFAWRDLFANIVCPLPDIRFEMVCILYNIGALHCRLGASEPRMTQESMKAACTHFQTAVWAFQHLKEHYPQPSGVDLSPEIMRLFQDICLAQAQECILEKSMQDSRKPGIVSAIGMQTINYYKSALISLEPAQLAENLCETVGVKNSNYWMKAISFKIAYIHCIVYLFQGMQSEEQQRMGERVAFYQAASDKLQAAKKLSKGLPNIDAINEALTFTNDVVEGKRKAAKNENEFIYHEEVPDKDLLSEPKPASLAKGLPINFSDPEVSGPDIFSRLVPMRAHEASSMYSEEKAKLLRKISASVEIKDTQLNDFMSSLQLDELNILNDPERLPQELVDICASLSVKTDAIQKLIDAMNALADIHTEVNSLFADIKVLIEDEEKNEKEYQQTIGKRPPSNISTELIRENNKYLEAHNKANESNQTLHKAMTVHLSNLKLLSLPLDELQKHVPSIESIKATIDNTSIAEMRSLVEKVNEMRAQRSMLVLQLREAVNSDDITSQLLTRTGESLDDIFKQEMEKHNKTVGLIEQNMLAQENILKALTDAYAKYAPGRKIITDTLRKRKAFFSAMITSYETYEDLMKKSLKGIEFYKKLHSTVSRQHSRLKSTCKVQQEEREQLLASNVSKQAPKNMLVGNEINMTVPSSVNVLPKEDSTPKLKDFLPYMKNRNSPQFSNLPDNNAVDSSYTGQLYPPYIRPAPVGSEDSSPAVKSNYFTDQDNYKNYQTASTVGMYNMQQYSEQNPYSYGQTDYSNTMVDSKSFQNTGYLYQPYTENLPPQNTNLNMDHNKMGASGDNSMNLNNAGYTNTQIDNTNYSNVTAYPTMTTNYTTNMAYPNSNTVDPYGYGNTLQMKPTSDPMQVMPNSNVQETYIQSQMSNQNYGNQQQHIYNQDQTQIDATKITNQMHNLNVSYNLPTETPINAYSGNYSSVSNVPNPYDATYSQNMYNTVPSQFPEIPMAAPQQNLNINPAHITSTINPLSNMYTRNNFNQGVESISQVHQPNLSMPGMTGMNVQNPYIANQAYNSDSNVISGSQPIKTEMTDSISSHSNVFIATSNPGYPYNNVPVQNPVINESPSHTVTNPVSQSSDDLPIRSHVQGFIPENAPNMTDMSSYSYQNVYYPNNTPMAMGTGIDSNQTAAQQYNVQNNMDPSNTITSNSYANHPGYVFNAKTGIYDYNYGYQNSSINNPPEAYQNTPYDGASQQNLYTNAGTYGTVQSSSTPVEAEQPSMTVNEKANDQYYSLPYGHQSINNTETNTVNEVQYSNNNEQPNASNEKPLTYMNSNDTKTTTTYSNQGKTGITTSSSTEDSSDTPDKTDNIKNEIKEPSSMDLLSGLDFSIEQTPLMPEIKVPPVSECVIRKAPVKSLEEFEIDGNTNIQEEVPIRPPKRDIFSDPSLLNKFTQEVKNMQLFVDGLTKKTHSGITMLDSKWKKIQETQAKENHHKTTNDAKSNLQKNASPDVVTYDDLRVLLKNEFSQSYVNASHLKQISSWCSPLIVADLPSEDNYCEFWHMILQQNVSIMVCLLTEIELQGKFYGPTAKSQSLEFPSGLSVTLDDINCNVNWTDRKLVINYNNVQHKITHYQINVFPARVVSAPLVMLIDKVLNTRDANISDNELPVTLVHCNSGAGRSALIILLTMVMCQVRSGYVDLRDMLDSGIRYLCGARTNVLEDTKYLVDVYRTVLFYVQGVLCSGTVMFNGEAVSVPTGASIPPPHLTQSKRSDNFGKFSKESFEEMKQAAGLKSGDMQDPLSYLDPLWSLKKRKD